MAGNLRPEVTASPLRRGPWIMRQRWHNLLFAHWPLDPLALRAAVPRELQIDTFGGEAWLGLVVFGLSGIKLRGLPEVKPLASFPEVNLRTYVSYQGQPGVYFISLDADNPLAVAIASRWFKLNYYDAEIRYTRDAAGFHFKSRRIQRRLPEARLDVTYAPADNATAAPCDERLQEWLTERYCYYVARGGRVERCDIEHRPWSLQSARAGFRENSIALPYGIQLDGAEALLHYSRYMEAHIWPLRRTEKRPCMGSVALRSLQRQLVR
ncbi:MAG TPA: DUF2071 domain-containing protein [Chloroflexia bacterium]|jgi:hypothetical protein